VRSIDDRRQSHCRFGHLQSPPHGRRLHPWHWKRDGPSGSIFGVLSEKQAYKVARNLLKDFALECIAEEATRQNLSPSIREKVQAKALREVSKQTENFSTHWAEFSAKGLAKVTDLEDYVKRKLVAAGDFKDLRKKVVAQSLLSINEINKLTESNYAQAGQ
jgi:hypothetical protein